MLGSGTCRFLIQNDGFFDFGLLMSKSTIYWGRKINWRAAPKRVQETCWACHCRSSLGIVKNVIRQTRSTPLTEASVRSSAVFARQKWNGFPLCHRFYWIRVKLSADDAFEVVALFDIDLCRVPEKFCF